MPLVELHSEEIDDRIPRRSTLGRQIVLRGGEDGLEIDRAEEDEDAEDAEREAEVADAVDDEGLHRRRIGGRLLVPEADQQV